MHNPWEILANFQSNELVKRRYRERHSRDLNTTHALEICSCINQGASYFKSAKDSDLVVKPLLVYYGVLALARGASMYLRVGRREASLSQSHGLETVNWGQILADSSCNLGDISIRVTRHGSFHEFADATRNKTLLRLQSNKIILVASGDSPVSGQTFTLADLLSRLPELSQQFSRWRPDGRCAIGRLVSPSPMGKVVIRIEKQFDAVIIDREWIDRINLGLKVLTIEDTGTEWQIAIEVPPNTVASAEHVPGYWDQHMMNPLGIGTFCFIGRYSNRWFGSKPLALFSLAYILGMLARYFPSHWTALVRNQGRDGAMPTIMSTLDILEKLFPQMVADFFEE